MWLGCYRGGSKDLKKRKSEKRVYGDFRKFDRRSIDRPSNLIRLRDRLYSADLFIKSGHKLTTPPRSKR